MEGGGGGKSGEVRWLPSAELGGLQAAGGRAAGVLWFGARPALYTTWALVAAPRGARLNDVRFKKNRAEEPWRFSKGRVPNNNNGRPRFFFADDDDELNINPPTPCQ